MIQIKDLNFSYPRQQALFKGLSLSLNTGSITGLLGKNGAGKTSFLKLITGLLYPKSGEITISGYASHKRDVSILKDIFFVPEEFYFPHATIGDYVRVQSSFYPKFDHIMMERLLVEMEAKKEGKLHQLSHGEKKKIMIAFALSTKCRLLILDEPTNGLDIPSKTNFRKVVASSIDKSQLVLISTHQVKDVENLINDIIILDSGKIIFQQSTAEISQKVSFVTGTHDERVEAIYSEETPNGYRLIKPRTEFESEVDIELLFNAIIKGNKIDHHANK